MKQQSFSDMEYARRRRITRRDKFLNTMEELIPWEEWVDLIRPFYYRGRRGRKPISLETILRMYLLQNWFQLSSGAVEDAVYDSYAMRSFLGINFIDEQVPDATTLLRFRRLLKAHQLDERIEEDLTLRLKKAGLILRKGLMTDTALVRK